MIERELKHYFLTIPTICRIVDKHIYAGRTPQTVNPTYAIRLRKLSQSRSYGLFGEDEVTQSIITVDLLSRESTAETVLDDLFENCRKALNRFAGAPGKMGSDWIVAVQIVSETVDIPQLPVATGLSWKRQRSFDVQIMHTQETSLIT